MRSALLNVMVKAATKAGRSLTKDFGEVENLQVSVKGPADFVSNADRRAEQIVFDELQKARPTYGFLGEEGTEVKGTDGQHRWIVDPLDGTTNFLHGIPLFAVAIALERERGDRRLGDLQPDHGRALHRRKGRWRLAQRPQAPARRRPQAPRRHRGRHRHQLAGPRHRPAAAAPAGPDRPRPSPASAAPARPRPISPGSPPAASTATGKPALQPWDVAPGLLLVKRSRRLRLRLLPARPARSGTARSSPATRTSRASCSRSSSRSS